VGGTVSRQPTANGGCSARHKVSPSLFRLRLPVSQGWCADLAALGLRLRRFAIGPLHPPVRRDGSLARYQQPAGVGGRLRSCLDARMPSPSLMSVSSTVSIPIVGGCICSCPAIALPHHHLRFARFIPVTMQPSVSRPNAAYVLRHACMTTDNPHSAAPGRRLPLRQDGGQRGLQRVGTEPRPRYLLASTAITVLGAGSGICLAIASRLMAGTVVFFGLTPLHRLAAPSSRSR